MTGSMTKGIAIGCFLLAATIAGGCSSGNTSLGGGQSACASLNWRAPTPDAVACPGAPGCSCGSGQVCCVKLVNNRVSSGSCTDLTACKGPALQCDGPEDCPSGQVCCLVGTTGGGSSCMNPTDCFGAQDVPFCRADSDCDTLYHCTPAEQGSYLDGIAGSCQL